MLQKKKKYEGKKKKIQADRIANGKALNRGERPWLA